MNPDWSQDEKAKIEAVCLPLVYEAYTSRTRLELEAVIALTLGRPAYIFLDAARVLHVLPNPIGGM